jgi:hypothetical protein
LPAAAVLLRIDVEPGPFEYGVFGNGLCNKLYE